MTRHKHTTVRDYNIASVNKHVEEINRLSKKLKKVIAEEYKEELAAAEAANAQTFDRAPVVLNTLLIMVDELIETADKPWPPEIETLKKALSSVIWRIAVGLCTKEEIGELMRRHAEDLTSGKSNEL